MADDWRHPGWRRPGCNSCISLSRYNEAVSARALAATSYLPPCQPDSTDWESSTVDEPFHLSVGALILER
ncbi:hypothetical protein, partial [Nocardioides sp.]|uniref:hypothetical protein n=1 Tax=Nocardioides sp. TaxID=35761 RepID=UPI0035629352